ncbi:PIG-L deacetylase family protein [Bryobacter aggregatus]|uniref:PIG-L deacetylase family protein n=1 Tax=Bryobacter aggregatus TaxID=360054 RepID=UPI0004E20152|nr:PIG-L family deacetylase [Bryobacter aggregatus]
MRILAIHAHPDDIEILAGGAFALLARAGVSLTFCTMTPGDCGSAEMGPEEIAALRRVEAATAAMMLGADYICAEYRDMRVFNDEAGREKMTQLLRRVRPDIVITANTPDYHCDHEATHLLVRDACFGASTPNYVPGEHPALDHIPHLYFMDSTSGIDRDGNTLRPEFLVDVAETIEMKAALIGCHESQRAWLKKQHGLDDYVDSSIRWTAGRGALAGLAYAEGFRQYHGHPYPQTPLLQEMFERLTTVVNL